MAKQQRVQVTMRELVEWTYAVQRAHRGGVPSVGGCGISQTGLVIERLRLGCAIDKSPGAASFVGQIRCADDALVVHSEVERLRYDAQRALIYYGSTRSAPEWRPEILPLCAVSVPGRRGMPKGIYKDSGKTLIGHEITYVGDWPTRDIARSVRAFWPDAPSLRCAEDVIEYARELYIDWWVALKSIYSVCCDVLRGQWDITGIGAVREPWSLACDKSDALQNSACAFPEIG